MKKTNLVLIPVLSALLLTGCTTAKKSGKKKSSTSGQVTSNTGGKSGTNTTTGGTTTGGGQTSTTPTPSSGFSFEVGTHTVTVDFESNIDQWTSGIPRAEQGDTEAKEGDFLNMKWNMFHSYRGEYEGAQWLMMKDKDSWDTTSTAWFGNKTSLGSIESLSVYVRTGASANKKYDLSVGDSAFTSVQSGGTQFDVSVTGSYTGSGKGFFCVSTKKDTGTNKYNGQIAKIVVTYTIS